MTPNRPEQTTTSVRNLLMLQQQKLATVLTGARQVIQHPTSKGDATEERWKEVLSEFLPNRYQVSRAFVIDAHSNISQQIDLVVHDAQYCPLLLEEGGARYIPAESVYAVFEVKQAIDASVVAYAADKAASVRKLHRTSLPVVHHGGEFPVRPPFRIIAGVLTLESNWSNPPLGAPFHDALSRTEDERALDLGCVLNHGGFVIEREPGQSHDLRLSDADGALMFFLQSLFTRLQQMGTVSMMDLGAYTSSLSSSEST